MWTARIGVLQGAFGSNSRLIVNSMLCDRICRQLSTSVSYRFFGNRSKYSRASCRAKERSPVNFSCRRLASPELLLMFWQSVTEVWQNSDEKAVVKIGEALAGFAAL